MYEEKLRTSTAKDEMNADKGPELRATSKVRGRPESEAHGDKLERGARSDDERRHTVAVRKQNQVKCRILLT